MTLGNAADAASGKYMLIVEASDDEAARLQRMVVELGIGGKLERVRSADEVIQFVSCTGPWAGREPRRPAVVLLNPGPDDLMGGNVVLKLRAERAFASLPLVVLTGSHTAKKPASNDAIASGYMRKPLSPASVMSCWRYWTSLSGLPNLK